MCNSLPDALISSNDYHHPLDPARHGSIRASPRVTPHDYEVIAAGIRRHNTSLELQWMFVLLG